MALLAYHEARSDHAAPDARRLPPPQDPRSLAHAPTTRATRATATKAWRELQVGVLVIGSGAGGAVTALELARHGHDVLLMEEGAPPGDELPDAGATETMAQLYRHRGMMPILGHVPIAYVEGRCLGGSTEINSGFWHRPPHEALLRWKSEYDLAAVCSGMLIFSPS